MTTPPADAFAYLSVLISVVVGLGMSHLLSAAVDLIRERRVKPLYWPSVLWGVDLFLLLTLVWWSDFSLTGHRDWTFASFLLTLAVPACVYVACGLIFPHDANREATARDAYYANRRWMLGFVALGIALSFVQTLLLDGHITIDADSGLKALVLAVTVASIFSAAEWVQRGLALFNLAWSVYYVATLFATLDHHR